MKGYKLRYQYWPRDIHIRRNLTTSSWVDVLDLVATNNMTTLDHEGTGIPNRESTAIRGAIVVGEDGFLKLPL
jgi:hypothetical protein